MRSVILQVRDELFGRHARPDDKCQDPFPLKAAKCRLFAAIFLLQSQQKGFSLQFLPQYSH